MLFLCIHCSDDSWEKLHDEAASDGDDAPPVGDAAQAGAVLSVMATMITDTPNQEKQHQVRCTDETYLFGGWQIVFNKASGFRL